MNLINRIISLFLFKLVLIYGFFFVINGVLLFLLLFILIRFLSFYDYGLVIVFIIFVAFYNVFIGLNINGVVFNKFFFSKDNFSYNFSEYLSNSFILFIILILVVGLLSVVFLN